MISTFAQLAFVSAIGVSPIAHDQCDVHARGVHEQIQAASNRLLKLGAVRHPRVQRNLGGCAVVTFSIDANGVPSDVNVLYADRSWMRGVAKSAAMRSTFKPGARVEGAIVFYVKSDWPQAEQELKSKESPSE